MLGACFAEVCGFCDTLTRSFFAEDVRLWKTGTNKHVDVPICVKTNEDCQGGTKSLIRLLNKHRIAQDSQTKCIHVKPCPGQSN